MAGNFFGGQFFGGGFFGAIVVTPQQQGGGGDIGGRRIRKSRAILPDGTVVWATRAELRGLLDKLSKEYQDEERRIVPVVHKLRKGEELADIELSPIGEEDFAPDRPQIRLTRIIETPAISVDTEAMLRAYIEGQTSRQRKAEEEWMLMMAIQA